nr:hypothetical protein [Tanacetum cinerariifolium]
MSSSVDNRPRPVDTGEIIFLSSGRRVEDDYFDGVFVYLNKMLMEEDDLANKPYMLIDSLALQATEKSFYNVLVEDHPSIQETELLKIYDTTLLCEDEITHLWPLHNPCWGSFHGIPNGSRKKKRRKMVVEVVDLTELLIGCARKVASFEMTVAIEILKTIRKHSSPKGSSSERMAHYFANAIEARLRGRGTQVYRGVSTAYVSAVNILKSYKTYITACPFQRMSNIYANKSIGKLANGRDKLHIIDFGILYGFQWPCIIQGLSVRPGGPPKLRITGIDLPQPGLRPNEWVDDTNLSHTRLVSVHKSKCRTHSKS